MKLKYVSSLEKEDIPKNDVLYGDVKELWKSSTQSRNKYKIFDSVCVVEMHVEKDGALFLKQDDNMIYFYPDQVKHLKKILGMK